MPLPARKQAFVDEFTIDLNGAAAAIRAGYSPRGARQQASRLMDEPAVQDAVDAAMAARSQRTHVSADRVIRELARIAFADIRDTVDWDAGGIVLRPSADLSTDSAAAIVEVSQTITGRQRTLKVKLAPKLEALKALMPHLGLKTQASEDEDATVKARQLLDTLRAMEASVVGPADSKVDAA